MLSFFFNSWVQSIAYFIVFPSIWSGENAYTFFRRAAWIVSAYAIGECAGYLIYSAVYFKKKVSAKTSLLLAIALTATASILFVTSFDKTRSSEAQNSPFETTFRLSLFLSARIMQGTAYGATYLT